MHFCVMYFLISRCISVFYYFVVALNEVTQRLVHYYSPEGTACDGAGSRLSLR